MRSKLWERWAEALAPDCHRLSMILKFIFFFSILNAQEKYSNVFLELGIGAAAHGQGTAVIARCEDATAGYWNPALLSEITVPFQASAMHSEWFGGVAKLDYVGFAKQLSSLHPSAIGLSVIRLGIDQIPNTLNILDPDGTVNFDRLSVFSAADYAFMLSYGRQIQRRGPAHSLAAGGSIKLIRRLIGSFGQSWGYGLDAGIVLKRRRWRLGLMARDVSFTFNAWYFSLAEEEKSIFLSTGNALPENRLEMTRPRFIPALAWTPAPIGNWLFELELDLHLTVDGRRNTLINGNLLSADPCLGAEISYKKFLLLRGGVLNIQRMDAGFEEREVFIYQPTFGIGLVLGRLTLDYAFTDLGGFSPVVYTHLFSLQLDFNPPEKG